MEPKNHPIQKENHLPSTSSFWFKMLIFPGLYIPFFSHQQISGSRWKVPYQQWLKSSRSLTRRFFWRRLTMGKLWKILQLIWQVEKRRGNWIHFIYFHTLPGFCQVDWNLPVFFGGFGGKCNGDEWNPPDHKATPPRISTARPWKMMAKEDEPASFFWGPACNFLGVNSLSNFAKFPEGKSKKWN